ncbi:MAG: Hpt domain-containing protein [Rhodanobacteraceae bacterium]
MKLQDDMDFTTLNWIKHELDDTLKQARQALESYVENTGDESLMRTCAGELHQAQGSLRMVEMYGAALVVEEMERLADALLADTVSQRDEAYSVLMRGMVQLPDYLERVQSGYKDIPIVLLPLLNDLRACRGQKLLSESALFAPDLDAVLPDSAAGIATPLPAEQLRVQAIRLRLAFQAALLKWFRDERSSAYPDRLLASLDKLRGISCATEARRLWWIAAGVIEAVRDGGLESSVAVKLLFGRVDREIRHFAEAGERDIATTASRELVKNLLYYVAHSTSQGARVRAIRNCFKLDSLLPTENELKHAQGSMSGHNRSLLDTVSVAIKDDLLRVKEALDIFLRAHADNPSELQVQAEVLDRVGDTLGMLGLGVPRRVVGEQRDLIEAIANGQHPADESTLLDIAGALLYVESSLDDHIEQLGAGFDAPIADGYDLPRAEVRKILDALMHEAAINIQQAKHDIIAFIEAPWDHGRVESIPRLLEEIAGALRMLVLERAAQLMSGIVRFVEVELLARRRVPSAEQMDTLADALASIEYYLEATREQRGGREKILEVTRDSLQRLGYWPARDGEPPKGLTARDAGAASVESGDVQPVQQQAKPPVPADAEAFVLWDDPEPTGHAQSRDSAEAIASDHDVPELSGIDLPLEDVAATESVAADIRLDEVASPAELDSVVDIAPGNDLRDLIVGETQAPEMPTHDVTGLRFAETPANDDAGKWIEVEEEFEEPVDEKETDTGGFETIDSGDIDDDIRAVFIEEVEEESERMRRQFSEWQSDPSNLAKLAPLRRGFHTLKGSGRLVGAVILGEFAWKVEHLLNRVLEQDVHPGSAVQSLVEHALNALPQLLQALRGEPSNVNVGTIMATADKLAAGEEAWVYASAPAMRMVRRKVRRWVPLDEPDIAGEPNVDAVAQEEDAVASDDFSALPTDIDPVLFDILKTEVAAHLGTVGTYLDACVAGSLAPPEIVKRAVHTLAGAIAMVDLTPLASVLMPLEGYVGRLRDIREGPSGEGIALIRESLAMVRDVMSRLERGEGAHALPEGGDLAARIAALRDSLPEAAGPLEYIHDEESHSLLAPVDDDAFEQDADAPTHEAATDSTSRIEPPAPVEETSPQSASDLAFASALDNALDAASLGSGQEAEAESKAEAGADAEPRAEVEEAGADAKAEEADVTRETDAEARTDVDTEAEAEAIPEGAELLVPGPSEASDIPAVAEGADIDEAMQADETGLPETAAPEPEAEALLPEASATSDSAEIVANTADIPPASDTPEAGEATIDDIADAADAQSAEADAPSVDEPAPAFQAQPFEPGSVPDIDEDLLEIFVEEGTDILDDSDSMMARLRTASDDATAFAGLQRGLHTLKGGARMAGLAPIGDLTHAMESLLEAVDEGRRDLDQGAISALEQGFDALHGLIQRVAQHRPIEMPTQLIAGFAGLVSGEPSLPESEPMAAAPEAIEAAAEAPEASQTPEPEPEPAPALAPAARQMPSLDDEESARTPHEMIRVRSDLLDSLVNYAGEVSIYRSRLEQQIASFHFNLVEFEQTVARLREQLRKLEMETEAQIIARFQREQQEGLASFDPLELDRFSQLQQYSRALGESVSDLVSIQSLLDDSTRLSETLLLQQARVSSDLQEGLMRTRMVPFESLVPSLRRTLRQVTQELGKQAQLKVEGAQGEMDRNLLERMKAPFEHLLRNALAHGIEPPAERRAAGKPVEGTVGIAVSRDATEVVLRVSDDGRGMDRDAIRERAIERGLLKPAVQLSDHDLYGFVLESGFSTADEVTQLAGRGVGMDVVNNEIKQLGGSLQIDSNAGVGTSFTLRLPFTLAVTQAILVKLGEAVYAIPMSSVLGVVRIDRDDLDNRLRSAEPTYSYAGDTFALYELSQLLNVPPGHGQGEDQVPLLMTRSGDQRAGVRIDSVVGSREIVVKSVGPQISSVPGVFGATIMGDGSVVIILDLAPLIRRTTALRERVAEGEVQEPATPAAAAPPETGHRGQPLIMVVDDSITMRKVTTRVLERADMDVFTAKDGLDAVEKLQERIPDLMLLDIEMPRMDGYELATFMRNDARLKHVPIIMITSRTGEKHRQRALEIGVERYIGKPYQEAELVQNVQEILRSAGVDA